MCHLGLHSLLAVEVRASGIRRGSPDGAVAAQHRRVRPLPTEHEHRGIRGGVALHARRGIATQRLTFPCQVQTRQISGTAGIFSAEQVARETVNTIASGGAITAIGFEGWMLGTLTAGARSEPSFVQAVAQVRFTSQLMYQDCLV